jgi:PAS domain S-box-containing protein
MISAPDYAAHSAAARIDAEVDSIGLAAAVDQAGHGVVITDRDGDILYVNASFTRMTGYSLEEVIGRNPSLLTQVRHETDRR